MKPSTPGLSPNFNAVPGADDVYLIGGDALADHPFLFIQVHFGFAQHIAQADGTAHMGAAIL